MAVPGLLLGSVSQKRAGQVRRSQMAVSKTKISPALHFVRCRNCDWRLEFERTTELSSTIHATGPLYTDHDLQKGMCPNCGSGHLRLVLKNERRQAFGARQPTSGAPEYSAPKPDLVPTRLPLSHETRSAPDGILGKFYNEVFSVEQRTDLSDEEKVNRIRHTACAACAVTAIQPIPFADIFVLTPIQGFFATRIAAIRGVKVSENDGLEWTKQIVGLMGAGFIAQQVAIGVWKLVTWGVGGLLTLPLVYSLTYAVMTTADVYFKHRAAGIELTDDQLREEFRKATKAGNLEAKKHKSSIQEMTDRWMDD